MLGEPGFLAPAIQTAKVTTTDATATLIYSYAIPTNCAGRILVTITGRKSDGSDRAAYTKLASFYRASSAGAQGGSTETIGTDYESDSSWDVAVDVSSSVLRVRVTGAASTTIYWNANVQLTVV
jgi:hypothetical protein